MDYPTVEPEAWKDLGDGEHPWPRQDIGLHHFKTSEFDHPEYLDREFLLQLDYFRLCCGFGVKILDDARTMEEQRALYHKEIRKEKQRDLPEGTLWPNDSSHLFLYDDEDGLVESFCRAVDARPWKPNEERELLFDWLISEFHRVGIWPHLGKGSESRHWHIDDTPSLDYRRPAFWVACSR